VKGALRPDDWMCTVDLSDAVFHVLHDPDGPGAEEVNLSICNNSANCSNCDDSLLHPPSVLSDGGGGWIQPTGRPMSLAQGRLLRLTKLDSTNRSYSIHLGFS
jgi:hypothetical protein